MLKYMQYLHVFENMASKNLLSTGTILNKANIKLLQTIKIYINTIARSSLASNRTSQGSKLDSKTWLLAMGHGSQNSPGQIVRGFIIVYTRSNVKTHFS